MRRRAGLTLAEGLVSLALAISILTVIATLIARVSQSSREAAERERIQQSLLVTLGRIASEARAANRWIQPARSQTAALAQIEFELPDLSRDGQRLPHPVPEPDTLPVWRPRASNFQQRVLYQVSGGALRRTLTVGGQSGTLSVLEGVASLRVRRSGVSELHFVLEPSDLTGGARKLELTTRLPLTQAWRTP